MNQLNGALRRVSTIHPKPKKKEATMYHVYKYLMATLVAVFAFTLPHPALAQDPPAKADVKVDAKADGDAKKADEKPKDKADEAKPEDKKEEAKPASPMFCTTMTQCIAAKDLFVNMGVKFGGDWAKGVKDALDVLVENKAVRKDLDNLPEGAIKQMAYLGGEPMNREAFDKYLADNDCKQTGTNADTGLKEFSAGCEELSKKLAPIVKKAIDETKAEAAVKKNANYLYGKAMEGLLGDQKIAMLHLAGLMLPFTEWEKGLGLTNDLNVLVGKDACFLKPDGEKKCGKITVADASGVTIGEGEDAETVSWDKLQGGGDTVLAIGDTKLIEENWGKGGGYPNDGLFLMGETYFASVFPPDQSNLSLIMFGGGIGWTAPTVPFTLMASLGGMCSPGGAVASHYSEIEEGGDRCSMYFKAGLGFRPQVNDWFGVNIMASGFATTWGGGGFLGELGPEFYLGEKHNLVLGANFLPGYVHTGKAWGANPGSSLPDPVAQGAALGGGLSFKGQF